MILVQIKGSCDFDIHASSLNPDHRLEEQSDLGPHCLLKRRLTWTSSRYSRRYLNRGFYRSAHVLFILEDYMGKELGLSDKNGLYVI